MLWIGMFLVLPFVIIISYSFFESAPLIDGVVGVELTLSNYVEFFTRSVYLSILWDSFVIAVATTVITLVLVYPAAYYLAFSDIKYKNLFLLLFILPFWMNIVIRTYAWRQVFGDGGLVNYLLSFVGAGPVEVMFTKPAVVIGLVHVFLPFMLLPVYSSLSNIDRSQIESAKNLGANRLEAFIEITLPQSAPGVGAGVMLVFVLSFGAFVVPELLGGAQNSMIANLIGSMFLELQSWEVGSAVAVIFTVLVLALVYVFNRVIGLEGMYGGDNA
ncbi:spermidine/putrescine ABC transporter permease [Natronorubrum bangense JCM 10635]|uniref:Spermidine/putrescine ABC transporter permease n=1 Tax=Natronorubrum bangense JCM 10635 TaxID=1227500 RepID=L9WI79_9EURY|nr:spermidine/putrescine ABC transporter permease [Natronorubrum bangense JCM 10635]